MEYFSFEKWLAPGILVVIFSLIVSFAWDDFSDKLYGVQKDFADSLSGVRKDLTENGKTLARLDERTKDFDRRIRYLEDPVFKKAIDLGYKNPEIIRTSLSPKSTFQSKTSVEKKEYSILYTIKSYDRSKKILKLGLDAQLPHGNEVKNFDLELKVKPGEIVNLAHTISMPGMTHIFLQILELPSPDKAILVIGLKTDTASQTS